MKNRCYGIIGTVLLAIGKGTLPYQVPSRVHYSSEMAGSFTHVRSLFLAWKILIVMEVATPRFPPLKRTALLLNVHHSFQTIQQTNNLG